MFVQRPGNAAKRHYRYYACAKRVEDRSCAQPYISATRLEGAVIGKIRELSTRPDLIRPFLAGEIKRRKATRRDRERRARGLERRIAELEARQRQLVDWLIETLPGKAAARKLNEKIERL
jgi:acyl-CoA reductase-like NAD-dependent aldehyde dehydrogenase